MDKTNDGILEAFGSIIEGKTVKRSKHHLIYEGRDLTAMFLKELDKHGYRPVLVSDIDVLPGERVPAFLIRGTTAYFGWVFWERFTSSKARKLWGSSVKNAKGDWEIQLPPSGKTEIYANVGEKLEMDIDHPPEF